MTLHDDIFVSTIVENTLPDWLRDVSVQAQHDQTLDVRCQNCSADLVWKLGDLAPGHHTTVWWQVRAMNVGQAVFNNLASIGDQVRAIHGLQEEVVVSKIIENIRRRANLGINQLEFVSLVYDQL